MAELKPCPFCGGKATLKHYASKELFRKQIQYAYAQCDTCDVRTKLACTDAEASNVWNRRAEDG